MNFLRYPGNKSKFVEFINEKISQSKFKTYFEPFLGSASVFLNLEKEFDRYVLNDLDSNLITIFTSVRDISWKDFESIQRYLKNELKIDEEKENYYNFRNCVNKHFKNDEYLYGVLLYFLYGSCINSIARFGPNGFNQSFGARMKMTTKKEFFQFKSRISRAEIYNLDFFDAVKKVEERCLMFLDPPYIDKPISYGNIEEDFLTRFINLINSSKNNIIYTDIFRDQIDWSYEVLRKMRNISPNRKQDKTEDLEVMFFNY